jgi:hypothetical protein
MDEAVAVIENGENRRIGRCTSDPNSAAKSVSVASPCPIRPV